MLNGLIDVSELIKRVIKYLIMGFAIAIVSWAIPKRTMNLDEIAIISLTSASVFCILETYLQSFANSDKMGLGFGIGSSLVGFPSGIPGML